MQPLRDSAAKAASKVRSKVNQTSSPIYPWLFARNCDKDIQPVLKQWLQDKANLEYVSRRPSKSFKSDPSKNVVEAHAIVWTGKSGTLEAPYPGRYLVIIGLEYVDENNGLLILEDTKSLDHGKYILILGDDTMNFSNKGGGISLLVILDLD
ncbi:hypothetical protein AJ80_03336 [Polytolypa hystricis UAMH7299]|uniref:Uncharacterized protein n=1 Tax=Polytolypa hystricis (strain UAMH7299) TaxID=1447883 RepID=A0A2B7YIB6_POLH7|nr:hypothetical protein AJ80_03336 [Polytolypa hystricis UAMH7299]